MFGSGMPRLTGLTRLIALRGVGRFLAFIFFAILDPPSLAWAGTDTLCPPGRLCANCQSSPSYNASATRSSVLQMCGSLHHTPADTKSLSIRG